MSASSALQKAVIAALRSDAALIALVGGRVYDVPPSGAAMPYISLGPSDFRPERQDGFARRIEVFQVDVWASEQEQKQPCKAIADAVTDVLDVGGLSLDDPYGLGRIDLLLARVMDDPDGITKHAVLQFECEVTSG